MQQKLNLGITKNYYVYALIDPRNDEIFYIGKGKGRRMQNQLNKDYKKGIGLTDRINKMRSLGCEPTGEIIIENLDEETAYLIEELIIYRLGRRKFGEGKLVNSNRGGFKDVDRQLFYLNEINTNAVLERLNKAQKKVISSIKKISKITHINDISKSVEIYRYSQTGIAISIDSINCFFNGFIIPEVGVKLLKSELPVLHHNILSKSPIHRINIPKVFSEIKNVYYESSFFDSLLDLVGKPYEEQRLELNNKSQLEMVAQYKNGFLMIACKVGCFWSVGTYVRETIDDIFKQNFFRQDLSDIIYLSNTAIIENSFLFNKFFDNNYRFYLELRTKFEKQYNRQGRI